MEKKKANKKFCLEGYMEFLSSQKQHPLTANSLNKIISIHGFKKLGKVKKELINGVVETLDLIDPSRSTLKSSSSATASASAWLTQDEIIRDLNCLDWKECCVTSIEAVSLNSSSTTTTQQSLPKSKDRDKAKAKGKRSVDSLITASATLSSSPTLQSKLESKSKSNAKRKRSDDSLHTASAVLSST